MKKIIAVDVDEVLSASAEGFVNYSNDKWGTNLTIEDYDEHWSKMWQITEEETNERWRIYNDERIINTYGVFLEALEVLQTLAEDYTLVVATSRPKVLSADTKIWIEKNFPGVFSNVHFSGIYDNGATEGSHMVSKADMCLEIGADYLIDDQPKHCAGVAKVGVEAILFGDYPWNRYVETPNGVTRCKDWRAVQEYFSERI